MEKAIFKYNNSACAILCSKCKTIIKTGKEFNEKETLAFRGEDILEAQYCTTCLPIKIKEEVQKRYGNFELSHDKNVDITNNIFDFITKHNLIKQYYNHEIN